VGREVGLLVTVVRMLMGRCCYASRCFRILKMDLDGVKMRMFRDVFWQVKMMLHDETRFSFLPLTEKLV
jgi:hypothetical protein